VRKRNLGGSSGDNSYLTEMTMIKVLEMAGLAFNFFGASLLAYAITIVPKDDKLFLVQHLYR